jgi:bifunctional non-homologous end joining protein LigD
MALEEYKRKRDFKKTPEPEGKVAPKRAERFFCVQKHLASHLHYDFRLEHNGVLLSWAVPKGPSLDPKTKRLAMHVEDHPVDYGEFEGVIPEGYGAGIVMLWDRGTWTPETDDVDAALKKGDLKFTLDGYKLKGSWVLVRTGGRYAGARGGGDRSWLLIKHRDDWSGDLDITEFAPRSVKSDGDFEDILGEDTPAIWQSHRPAKGGDAGAMLATIIERAAKLKASGGAQTKHVRIARTEDTKETKATRDADAKTARAARTEDTKETKGTKGTKGTEGTTDTKRTTDAERRTKGTKVQRSQGTALKRKKST